MDEERVEDGRRIAELLASELSGRSIGPFGDVAVVNADTDVVRSSTGERAYDIDVGGRDLGSVYVYDTRTRVTFNHGFETVSEQATAAGLEVQEADSESATLHVFLTDGSAVKQVLPAVRAAVTELRSE